MVGDKKQTLHKTISLSTASKSIINQAKIVQVGIYTGEVHASLHD
jgi:hypothetical protein